MYFFDGRRACPNKEWFDVLAPRAVVSHNLSYLGLKTLGILRSTSQPEETVRIEKKIFAYCLCVVNGWLGEKLAGSKVQAWNSHKFPLRPVKQQCPIPVLASLTILDPVIAYWWPLIRLPEKLLFLFVSPSSLSNKGGSTQLALRRHGPKPQLWLPFIRIHHEWLGRSAIGNQVSFGGPKQWNRAISISRARSIKKTSVISCISYPL